VIALFRVDFSGRGELAERQVCYLHALTRSLSQLLLTWTIVFSKDWHRCFLD